MMRGDGGVISIDAAAPRSKTVAYAYAHNWVRGLPHWIGSGHCQRSLSTPPCTTEAYAADVSKVA